jgi:ABC-2 type transport system permease protein
VPATTPAASAAGGLLPLFAVVRSEFCKLRSVRSTFWALLAAVAFNVVTAALLGAILLGHPSARQQAGIDSTRLSLGGLHRSQVVIGLPGVLTVSSEYSTGMIRATLAAVPQRRRMLTAKALVLTAAALVTGLAAGFAAYLVFQAFLPAGDAMKMTLASPGVLRASPEPACTSRSSGCPDWVSAPTAAPAPAPSWSARCSCPALLAALLPRSWQDTIGPYLPLNAGESAYTVQHQAHALSPWAGGSACSASTRRPRWPPGSS